MQNQTVMILGKSTTILSEAFVFKLPSSGIMAHLLHIDSRPTQVAQLVGR